MPKKLPAEFPSHKACETLTGLTISHLPHEASAGRARHYRKGAYIWRTEDHADRIYFLAQGQVAVMLGDPQGHEVILRVIEAGEAFGELCFCTAETGKRDNSARAVIDCEAIEISYKDFVNYLQNNYAALHAFIFTFCVRLSDAERRAEVLAHRGAEERLGRLLLQLAATRGQPSKDDKEQVLLRASHDELALMAAMSRSHVTVTMGRLRRNGLVRYGRNQPLLVNVPALAEQISGPRSERREVGTGTAVKKVVR